MNKAIARIIRNQLLGLPFIERFAGLIAVQEKRDIAFSEDDKAIPIGTRFPVSADVVGAPGCEPPQGLVALYPDSSLRGMLYFEDLGITPAGVDGIFYKYFSKLRLVVWINTDFINMGSCGSVTLPLATQILKCLTGRNGINCGDFTKILIKCDRIPKTDKSIFAPYTFDSVRTPFLISPYEYLALDLEISYSVNPKCLTDISVKLEPTC